MQCILESPCFFFSSIGYVPSDCVIECKHKGEYGPVTDNVPPSNSNQDPAIHGLKAPLSIQPPDSGVFKFIDSRSAVEMLVAEEELGRLGPINSLPNAVDAGKLAIHSGKSQSLAQNVLVFGVDREANVRAEGWQRPRERRERDGHWATPPGII